MDEKTTPEVKTGGSTPPVPIPEPEEKVKEDDTQKSNPLTKPDLDDKKSEATDKDDDKSVEVGDARSGMKIHPPGSDDKPSSSPAPSSLGGVSAPRADKESDKEQPPKVRQHMGSALESAMAKDDSESKKEEASTDKEKAQKSDDIDEDKPIKPEVKADTKDDEEDSSSYGMAPFPGSSKQTAPAAPPKPESKPASPEVRNPLQDTHPFPSSAETDVSPTPPPPSTGVFSMASVSDDEPSPGKGPKAYLVEYFLSLVMTATLLGVAISFFSSIVNSIGDTPAASGWAAQFAYTSSLVTLSTALVFIVALVLVSHRCRKIEKAMPEIKQNKWRKGFLGIFLVLVGLATLTAATTMVYSLVSLAASVGVVSIELGDTVRSIINGVFAFILLASTLVLYSQDYRVSSMNAKLERLHHWGLIAGVVILSVFFVLMPLNDQRDAYIDGITSSDIRTLQRAVDDYARSEDSLPSGLRVLDVGDDIDGRLNNYEYEEGDDGRSYELCAEFRTDTTGESSSGNPLEDAFMGSGFGMSPSRENNPNFHEEGRQCFEYEAPISRTPSFNDGFEDIDDEWEMFFQ